MATRNEKAVVGGNGVVGMPVDLWDDWLSGSISPTTVHPRKSRGVGVGGGNRRVFRPILHPGAEMSLSLTSLLLALGVRRDGGVKGALGIDLTARGHEVRKLFYAGGFTGVLLREGVDPEDFLQEVYRGILARNHGTCPWDAKKSSFGHYVHIVITCLLSNYLRKERRRSSVEGVTDAGLDTDGEHMVGASTAMGGVGLSGGDGGSEAFHSRDILRGVFRDPTELDRAVGLVRALEGGLSRKEAMERLGLGAAEVEHMVGRIRDHLRAR